MAVKILDTKNATHDEWLEMRKKSIGGSDAGTVMGMNPYSSMISLYADKKGFTPPRPDNEAMRQGRDLEPYIADRYMEKTGKKVRNDFFMYRHCIYPLISANVDRRIDGENAGLECKLMGGRYAEFNFENGDVPGSYYCQCQHYMMVMGWDYMDLAILVPMKDLYVINIKRNDDFIQKLLEAEVSFWKDFIETDTIPAVDGSDPSIETLKELYPVAVHETSMEIPGLDQMIADYKDASSMEKHYKELKASIQGNICAKLGDVEVGIGTESACSWKSQSRDWFDTEQFRKDHPALYKKYVQTSSYRVFRTKRMKAKK